MTNAEIIMGECALRGITEDVHTYARWKQMGFTVKQGQKALFSTQLWKMSKKRTNKVNESNTDDEDTNPHMFLCKSFLFGQSQVEKTKEEK